MKHFTMEECTRSVTARAQGLDNTPTPEHVRNIEETVSALLDPLREAWALRCAREQWGTPALRISSGYRGFRLNASVGGSASSAHCVGYAFDMVPANGRLADFKALCREFLTGAACSDSAVGPGRAFDQLISEDENAAGVPRWLHLGWKNRQGGQRRQLLSMCGGKYKTMTV